MLPQYIENVLHIYEQVKNAFRATPSKIFYSYSSIDIFRILQINRNISVDKDNN
jgi:hypothetical protein